MLSRTLLCLAVTSASMPLLADTVWLKNGDKLSGKITAICFGGSATLSTPEAVELIAAQFCPTDGTIAVMDVGQIFYSNGALSIDTDNNGTPDENYPTCLDSDLVMCIG